MLLFEVPKSNEKYVEELRTNFPNCKIHDIHELGMDGVIEVAVSVIEHSFPVLSAIVVQCIINRQATVKFADESGSYELKGSEKFVEKQLRYLVRNKIISNAGEDCER